MDDEQEFLKLMAECDIRNCTCGLPVTIGFLSWNCGQTEYGTPMTHVQIHCPACLNEILEATSWSCCGEDNSDRPGDIIEGCWDDIVNAYRRHG